MTADTLEAPGYRRDALVLCVAVGVIGVTFGVLADAAGFSLARSVFMSAVVFTGASQFAAVGVVDSGGTGAAAVGSALLVATRNALYGPVVAPVLPRRVRGRLAGAHFVIDETTAMSAVQPNRSDAAGAFWFTGIVLWLMWNGGTVAGVLLGAALGEPEAWGLDAAFPASFVALLAPHVARRPGQVVAVGGAALAVATLPLTPAGVPLLVAVLAVVPGVLVGSRLGGRR
jgi:4-azaleucine resistance transporter AzlC